MARPKLSVTSNTTVGDALARVVRAYPDREAVVYGTTRLTYAQLQEQVDRLTRGLAGLGIGSGDRVAIMLPGAPEWVYSFFAVTNLGGVVVPINLNSRIADAEYILGHAEAVGIITAPSTASEDTATQFVAMKDRLPCLRHVVVVGSQPIPGTLSFQELMVPEGPLAQATEPVRPDDLAALVYTSGTTGFPKGTMHTHRGMIEPVLVAMRLRAGWSPKPNLASMARIFRLLFRYKKRLLGTAGKPLAFIIALPFHGISGLGVLEQSLFAGDKMVLVERIDPRECLETIQRERGTVFTPIPTTLAVMLRLKEFDRYDLSSLLLIGLGSMPVPPSLIHEVHRRIGCAATVSFGTTELGGPIAVTSIEDSPEVQAETVGKPLPGTAIKIVDDDRREVSPGEVGELAARVGSMMVGYYKNPEATAAVMDNDGFFYTGDLARLDQDGNLQIVGRKKDMIIRGGQNIYPAEVENHLVTHPQVAAAAVVGVPSIVGGEAVWAYIVPKESAQPDAVEIAGYCRQGLAAYKVPERIRVVGSLPLTASGKVQKYRLREAALAETKR